MRWLHAGVLLTMLWNVPGAVPAEPNVNRVLPFKSVTCVLRVGWGATLD